jgi:hypothetical protein
MATPIYVWYARKWTAAEWQAATTQPDFVDVRDSVFLAASDAGLGSGDGAAFAYRVTGDEQDSRLAVAWPNLPQLLFSIPVDEYDPTKGQVFVAKLVQSQINRKNIVTMLQTVKRLQPKVDPATQQVSFFDPTLKILPSLGVSNSAQAPGNGSMVGLNPYGEPTEINRLGQMLGGLQKFIPWLIVGGVAYLANRRYKWIV